MTGAASAETGRGLPDAVVLAALLTAAAACLDVSLVGEYLSEWRPAGVFIGLVAAAQTAFAWLLLRRPSTAVALTGIAGNLAFVVLWTASRTYGLPVGADPPKQIYGHHTPVDDPSSTLVAGVPQGIAASDLAAAGLAVGVIAALVYVLSPSVRPRAVNALFGLGVAGLAVRVALVV